MTPGKTGAPSRWQRLRVSFPRAPSFRSWTIDANGGIIGTSGILEGFAGAGASHSVLVTAASAATIALIRTLVVGVGTLGISYLAGRALF